MEYCKDNNLQQLVKDSPQKCLPEEKAMQFFVQILQGLQSIHAISTVHRDIKCNNIVLHDDVAKIADFGLAKKLQLEEDLMTTSNCGTPPYEAPEILQGKSYGFKVDIWALGVVLYFMLFGNYPFGNDKNQTAKEQLKQIFLLCTPDFDLNVMYNEKNVVVSEDI